MRCWTRSFPTAYREQHSVLAIIFAHLLSSPSTTFTVKSAPFDSPTQTEVSSSTRPFRLTKNDADDPPRLAHSVQHISPPSLRRLASNNDVRTQLTLHASRFGSTTKPAKQRPPQPPFPSPRPHTSATPDVGTRKCGPLRRASSLRRASTPAPIPTFLSALIFILCGSKSSQTTAAPLDYTHQLLFPPHER